MTGTFLSAWLLFPVVLLACSLGCGLLVRRVSAGAPAPVLVLPVGFALVVAIAAFATSYRSTASLAGPVTVALAAIGFALEAPGALRRLRETAWRPRLAGAWIWPLLAALAAFLAVGGAAFLTGMPTWTGYTRIVDIGFQMDFANYLAHFGRHVPSLASSYDVVGQKLTSSGYPGGAQATLGVIARLTGVEVPWAYQPYLAVAASVGALAIYSVLGAFTRNGLLRALGAAVAILPNVLYGYALSGGIKELTTASLLMLVIALQLRSLPGDGPRRTVLPSAVAVAAAAGAFSFGVLPWLGIVFVCLLAVTLARGGRRRRALESWALLLIVAAILAIPTLITGVKLLSLASAAIGGTVELGLGNLAAPVPGWSAAGVWLTSDYRYTLVQATPSHVFDVLVIVLALVGFAFALRRRRWALAALGVSAPIALYYWIAHTGPWIQFKAFGITGTMALAIAFAGAGAMWDGSRRIVRALGLLAALTIAGVVLYGDAITYHDVSVAPAARYHDLAAIGRRNAGHGPTLYPAFDEYSEFFLRRERGSDTVNPANAEFSLIPGAPVAANGENFSVGTNVITQSFLQHFPLIVLPRSPVAERPPSDYEMTEQSKYFQVWRRERPSSAILDFIPLFGQPSEHSSASFCRSLKQKLRSAPAGAELAYAVPPEDVVSGLNHGPHPGYWREIGPDSLLALGAGEAKLTVEVPRAGRYTIWMEGSVGRKLDVYIDGHALGSVEYEERYPGQFLMFGSATLTAGAHTLRVVRGNGTLQPGSGDGAADGEGRTFGAIVFRHEQPTNDRVYVAPRSAAQSVCRSKVSYQWLEVVKPEGVPRDAIAVKG